MTSMNMLPILSLSQLEHKARIEDNILALTIIEKIEQEILKKKNDLISALRMTQEYRNYMQSNSAKLQEIDGKLQAYITPEIQALQTEIKTLTEEIYGSAR